MVSKSPIAEATRFYLIILVIVAIALAGCVPNTAPGDPSIFTMTAENQGVELTAAPVDKSPSAQPTDAAPEVTLADPPVVQPTIRQELYASDPAQFRMAAGEIQFVEFFAFW